MFLLNITATLAENHETVTIDGDFYTLIFIEGPLCEIRKPHIWLFRVDFKWLLSAFEMIDGHKYIYLFFFFWLSDSYYFFTCMKCALLMIHHKLSILFHSNKNTHSLASFSSQAHAKRLDKNMPHILKQPHNLNFIWDFKFSVLKAGIPEKRVCLTTADCKNRHTLRLFWLHLE